MSDKIDISKALEEERKLLVKYREYALNILKIAPDSDYRNEVAERLKIIDEAAIAGIDEALKAG